MSRPKLALFLWGVVLGIGVTFGFVACSDAWNHQLWVEEVDGHEYVYMHGGGLVHKANCKGEKVEK